jgi:hypothetical protein
MRSLPIPRGRRTARASRCRAPSPSLQPRPSIAPLPPCRACQLRAWRSAQRCVGSRRSHGVSRGVVRDIRRCRSPPVPPAARARDRATMSQPARRSRRFQLRCRKCAGRRSTPRGVTLVRSSDQPPGNCQNNIVRGCPRIEAWRRLLTELTLTASVDIRSLSCVTRHRKNESPYKRMIAQSFSPILVAISVAIACLASPTPRSTSRGG